MRTQTSAPEITRDQIGASETRLDLVVPFTTTALTQAALDAANRMGAGLNAAVRLIRVQVVPFPLDLTQTPVSLGFIRGELGRLRSELPAYREIRLARDLTAGFRSSLKRDSVVVIACRPRIWITPQEKLASNLRRAGYHVVLVQTDQVPVHETAHEDAREYKHA